MSEVALGGGEAAVEEDEVADVVEDGDPVVGSGEAVFPEEGDGRKGAGGGRRGLGV